MVVTCVVCVVQFESESEISAKESPNSKKTKINLLLKSKKPYNTIEQVEKEAIKFTPGLFCI